MKLNNIKGRLLAAALCLLGAVQAQAADFSLNGISYNILSMADLTCEVAKRSSGSYSGDIVIPETVTYSGRTFTVTQIGERAFSGASTLFTVKCPDTVTSIDTEAFRNCRNLVSVEYNSIVAIGDSAFSNCSSLTDITIPNSVTAIGESAFSGCSSLKSVTIPNSVTEIENSTFEGCSSLTSVTIPNSVTTIGGLRLVVVQALRT